ncbi:MAG: peptidoglycan-N-acetylglucosamine deacetylase [Leptolyngbya sp. DLM2.Bin15]|nr:MAG: peptidoglycan-N-acetylglucosamine deacetylase [Leptolyngbya sp. DLM2.Bin15]
MPYFLFLRTLSIVLGQLTQSRLVLSIVALIIPGVTYFRKTDKLIVALTIDDGPDPVTTPKILEVLQCYGARATFFVISNRVEGNEPLLIDMVNQGHELGNHLTEDKPSIRLSPSEFEVELCKAHSVLSSFTKPRWLRPASGWYTPCMVNTARKYNYRVALGSVFPFDTNIISSDFASEYILSNISPGSIIVLHDTGAWGEKTAITLEKVLPELSKKGYSVVTLSDLFTL